MLLLRYAELPAEPIAEFDSSACRVTALARGRGESHVSLVEFEPGGVIGPHPAGFAQLFVPLRGTGWIADLSGERTGISSGEFAFISPGEVHSKGSDDGMAALVIQMHEAELPVTATDQFWP
jgi:quercetin dioxygenase-like cupin family protein